MDNDLSALATALALMNLFGLWPVVLHPPGGGRNGKAPIGNEWGKTRPTVDGLRETFAKHPGAGVGIMLGPDAGVVDIEVDSLEGEESFLKLCDGESVETLGWSSQRGKHRLFLWDARLAEIDPRHRAKLTLPQYPGLEFRFGQGKQAQSACPPTIGEDGVARRWNDCDVIAPVSECMVTRLREALASPKSGALANGAGGGASHGPASSTDRVTRWFLKALENECGRVARAVDGTRHDALFDAARTLGGYLHHGYLNEPDVIRELQHAAGRAGLGELEISTTIRDGLALGKSQPLPWPDRLDRPDGARSGAPNATNGRAAAGPHRGPETANPDDDDDTPLPPSRWPEPPGDAAYHGLAGDAVRLIAPHTEADSFGILANMLVMFGSMLGRGPHMIVDGARHGVNENVVIVGQTAAARKGTARARARECFRDIDAEWSKRIRSGLSSGEGMIHQVRDPIWTRQPRKEGSRVTGHEDVMTDEGELDKRLLIIEPEFGAVLRALERDGNRLSALLRTAWDGDDLGTLTKSPYRATAPHISVIGDITFGELRALLSGVDISNGLAGRTVWVCVRRARMLPFGGETVDLDPIRARFREALEFSRDIKEMKFTGRARRLYEDHYPRLSSPPPGVLGEVTARATAHVIRWGMLYALTDRSMEVDECHLRAALAVIDASIRAAAFIFGDALGHPDAEKILVALRAAPGGLTRTEVSTSVFNRNAKAERIRAALAFLILHRRAREVEVTGTGGGSAFRYFANEMNEMNEKSPHRRGDNSFNSFNSYPTHPNGHPATSHPAEEREVFEL